MICNLIKNIFKDALCKACFKLAMYCSRRQLNINFFRYFHFISCWKRERLFGFLDSMSWKLTILMCRNVSFSEGFNTFKSVCVVRERTWELMNAFFFGVFPVLSALRFERERKKPRFYWVINEDNYILNLEVSKYDYTMLIKRKKGYTDFCVHYVVY